MANSELASEKLLHQLFEEQVRRTPDALAVKYGHRALRYSELNAKANQLARYLKIRGAGPDLLVALYVDRGIEMVLGLLAILKTGGVYLPLDPGYPAQRLAYLLKDASPPLVLTQDRLKDSVASTATQVITLESDCQGIDALPEDNLGPPSSPLTARSLAYVVYTSGSTGEPKGVAAEHRGMVNRVLAQASFDPFSDDDTCCHKTSVGFVDSIFETLGPLSNGRPLVVASDATAKDVHKLASLVREEQITRLITVPSLAQSLLETLEPVQSLSSVRSWTLSGEELQASLLKRLQQTLPKCRFVNLYGSSEVAADATFFCAGPNFTGDCVPIGRPLLNTQIYVLDARMQPVPERETGDIYVGGMGVARGYINRPDLSADRFIADPFSADAQARLYKTGDLGRWAPEGLLEYRGRNDRQVKLRGHRIELGEIEARLVRHDDVKEAVVVVRDDDVPGEKRLVAYVALRRQATAETDPSEHSLSQQLIPRLRDDLKAVLPEYMIPAAWVVLKAFPLTPNGKVDRRALPAPPSRPDDMAEYVAPRTELERTLAEIWAQVLRVDLVGVQDNFFELGGHSLLMVQVIERLRRVGLSVDVRNIYASPTLEDLARTLMGHSTDELVVPPNGIPAHCEAITPLMLPLVSLEPEHIHRIAQTVPGGMPNIQDIYPLAPLQEGILFHHLLEAQGGNTYIISTALAVPSRQAMDGLIAALQTVIDRHDILRTAVVWEHLPRAVQVVYRKATLRVEEISLDGARNASEQIREKVSLERQQLELRAAPLIRLQVAPDNRGDRWYAVLRIHHLICDNESFETLLSEVSACLEGRQPGGSEEVSYRHHVAQALAYAQSHDVEAFFRRKLGDVDQPTTPFGLLDVHGDGVRIEEARQPVDHGLASRIRGQSRRFNVSPATLFHAAWGLVVSHTSACDDVVFGTVLLGGLQGNSGSRRSLGMLVNTLPLRLRLEGATALVLVKQTQRELADLLSHGQASLAVAQRCSGVGCGAALFSTLLNYRHSAPASEGTGASASGIEFFASHDRTNYPITLSVDDLGDGFTLTAQTDPRIDPRRITGYAMTAMQSLLAALEHAPQTLALTLPILPFEERQQVLERFNSPQEPPQAPPRLPQAYPPRPPQAPSAQNAPIQARFEEQAERTPEAVAVTHEGDSLTYAALNARANQLAHHLRSRGVRPDQLVGLCVERGLDMVVGVLGILKAGGAYVPLDPTYPPDRLAYMLADAAPRVLLIEERLRSRLPEGAFDIIALDRDWPEIAQHTTRNPDAHALGLRADHLAYVIYTSGSTGTPKGVMVEHRNVTRLLTATESWFEFGQQDVWTLFHSFAFDFSVWELWGALLYGGRVVVVSHLTARSPQEFYRLLCDEGVTVLNQTPSAFIQLIGAQARDPGRPHALRVVIFGGEALELHSLQPWVERNGAQKPQLVNMYGITETTVHVTYRPLTQHDIESERNSAIGRPIPDLQIYLLDRHGQPAPIGVPGEIYVGGAGVARGYLNRPELTAQRFIHDPYSADPQARLYKSGDLGRWRTDGGIEYLGRNDTQVKIRGFRIELGEIEAQLLKQECVKEAVVLAREDATHTSHGEGREAGPRPDGEHATRAQPPEPGDKRLVAYVIAREETPQGLNIEALRTALKSVLPDHMVPAAFVQLDHFPLTANGKLDRKALPAPEREDYARTEYEPPQGEVEEILSGIWQSLLKVERVGRQDNFFELGGHSVLAMQVTVRLRSVLSVDVPMSLLFRHRTLRELSARVDELRQARLRERLLAGGTELRELLQKMAAMPEAQAQEWVRELRREGRL